MAVHPDAVDGIFQGDWIRNSRTGEQGKVTFADCGHDNGHPHESHVRINDTDNVAIWLHSEVVRADRG